MGAVDEGLGQVELAAVAQVGSERLEHTPEHALTNPLLHAAMAGLIRGKFARQRLPRRTGPEDPEDPVEHGTRGHAWAALAVLTWRRRGDQRPNNTPLLVRELHGLLDHVRDPAATFRARIPKSDRKSPTSRSRFRDAF